MKKIILYIISLLFVVSLWFADNFYDFTLKLNSEWNDQYRNSISQIWSWTLVDFRFIAINSSDEETNLTIPFWFDLYDYDLDSWDCNINSYSIDNNNLNIKFENNWNSSCTLESYMTYNLNNVGDYNLQPILWNTLHSWVKFSVYDDIVVSSASTVDSEWDWNLDSISVWFNKDFPTDSFDDYYDNFFIKHSWKELDFEYDWFDNWNLIFSLVEYMSWDKVPSVWISESFEYEWYNFLDSQIQAVDRVSPILTVSPEWAEEFDTSLDIDFDMTEIWYIYYSFDELEKEDLINDWNKLNFTWTTKTITIWNSRDLYTVWKDFAWNLSWIKTYEYTKDLPDPAPSPWWWGWWWGWGAPTCRPADLVCEEYRWDYIWQRDEWVVCDWWDLWDPCDPETEETIEDDEEDDEDLVDPVDEEIKEDLDYEFDQTWFLIKRWVDFETLNSSILGFTPIALESTINQILSIFERDNTYIYEKSLVSNYLVERKENIFNKFEKTIENIFEYRSSWESSYANDALAYLADYNQERELAYDYIYSLVTDSEIDYLDTSVYIPVDASLNLAFFQIEQIIFDKIQLLYENNQITREDIDEYINYYNRFVWNIVIYRIENSDFARQEALALIPYIVKYDGMDLDISDNSSNNEKYQRDLSVWDEWADVLELQNYLNDNWYWPQSIEISWYFWEITLSYAKNYLSDNYWIETDSINYIDTNTLNLYF